MRKGRTLTLDRTDGQTGSSHAPIEKMIHFRSGNRNSQCSVLLLFLILCGGCWMIKSGAEAGPLPALAGNRVSIPIKSNNNANSSSSSSRPFNRCPAIFPVKASDRIPDKSPCRYFLSDRKGTLTTPGFPSAFPPPFECSWFINATGYEAGSFITLYLTQMYLTRGVKAVQYTFRNETHSLGRKELDELHTLRPRPYSVYRIKASYLEVQVNLNQLVNANLRVEHRLMDVYGFNITYEIQPSGSRIRSDTCNAVNCTFNGHCYANHDYSQFQCSCLPGFSGKYCQYGPECNPEKGINICKNGGTCGYRTGLTVVRCSCPLNYNGSLCEFRREFIPAKECLSRFRLNCSHQCVVTDKGSPVCRCPLDQALRSDTLTCYPLVPLRVLGQLEISKPNEVNDSRWVDGVTATMKKLVEQYTAGRLALSSLNLIAPNSNRLHFVLWNSESYNISWTAPTTSFKYRSNSTSTHEHIASYLNNKNKRLIRNVQETQLWLPDESWNVTSTPHQWNVAYSSFVKQTETERLWKVLGETVQVRNFKTIQVPALLIDWVKLDVKGHVREGYPFTVACNANGSKKVKLEWFKDGHPVDAAFTLLRNMSVFVHQAQDLRGYFTLYLEVKQASVADRGEYQCRASDWGQSMRKSVFLDVITPPILDLMPINSAVYPGTAVNLTCRDENHLARRTITKYVWLKNGQPIESSCDEIIEDLTPVGSLLKITSIQNSTNYTCRGENGSSPANKTTHIFVVQPKQACPAEKSRGIEWPMTAADVTNYQFCPAGYIGVAKRHCRSIQELPDTDSTSDDRQTNWEETDFAHCTARNVSELYRQFKLITLGYLVTDFKLIVDKFTYLIHKKLEDIHGKESVYLPGEGNALLEMAKSLETFMLKKTDMLEKSFWHWTAVDYLYALDDLLSMPADFFRPDGGILVMRLIQNHVVLLDSNPSGVIDSTRLKNCDIDTQSPRKQLKYKRMLPILRSQSGFKILKQMAPAQLVLNGTNVTMDFHIADQMTGGGDYLCALLHLQPATDYSRSWDMDSCKLERLSDSFTFRCHCFNQGTVAILYAERESMEVEDGMVDLWIIIYFETSTCHLLVIIGLIILSCRWYRKRTIWAWFQIQLAISLLPMSSTYFLQTKSLSSNSFWAILLTSTTYLYVITVGAMMLIQLKNNSQRPGDTEMSGQRANLRLIGLSLGIPLALSGVQMLLEEFTSRSTFTNWLFELDSVSGIFFCLAYCTIVIIILVLYVISLRQTYPIDKSNESRLVNSVQYNHCCLALTGLSLLFTGSVLSRFKWMSLSIHCFAAMFHLLAVIMWSSLMLASSGTGYICTFWMDRSKMSGAGETVSEMLNATAMVESPQRRGLLSEEQHPCINGGDVTRTRRISHDSADDIVNPTSNRCKRQNRSGPASSPLLQRAGLGPDVLRAFGLEQSRPGKQSDRIIIMQGSSLSGMNEATDSIGRDRINSSTNSERMQRDDLDSGFGPSGGGGSQKFNRLDKFSDAWKFLSRMRWKLPQLVFPSNGSTSCGGSFRSRQSTMSSATTTEFGNERGSSVTTEETEIQPNAEDTESFMASYRLRRSRTRWTEDYGQENELDSREVANLTMVMCKPFRGRCFIRCSPEKIGSNTLWAHQSSGERLTRGCHPHNNCCERCWHNPETPFCDLCLISNPPTLNRPATISVQAVIENPPELPDVGEYLEMDSAGSIAVDEERAKRLKQEYYNVVEKGRSEPINRNNKDVVSCSSPTLSRPKKILSGRIVKKYRLSLRNVVHSTQQQWRQGGKQNETGPAIAGHRTERL